MSHAEIADMSVEDVRKLFHELRVHQMELEIQNEDLREAQIELAHSRDRYSDLYEFAPVGYLTLDRDSVIVEANLTAAGMLGVERSRLRRRRLTDFLPDEAKDVWHLHRRRVFSDETKQACELALNSADGSPLTLRLESHAFRDQGGKSNHCRTALIDVTERNKAEAAVQDLNRELEEGVAQRTRELNAANVELNKTAGRLRHLLDKVDVIIAEWDFTTKLPTFVNEHAEKILGYKLQDWYETRNFWESVILHPADREQVIQYCSQQIETARNYDFVYRARHADGRTVWIHEFVKVITNDSGVPTGSICVMTDISRDRASAEALRESEERFSLAIRGSADGIWDWTDVRQDVQWWSPRFYELLGYEPGEIEPRFSTFIKLLHPADRQRTQRPVTSHLEPDIQNGIEHRLRTKSGEYRWFRARAEVSRDERGNPVRMTGCLEDIHERKRMEDAFRSEHEFSEQMINTAQNIILVLNTDGCIVRYNPFMEQLSGWSLEEVRGHDWFDTFLPERDRQRIRDLFRRALKARTRVNTNPILTKEGCEREIEWSDATLTNKNGQVIGLLCTGQDVTPRKALERHVLEIANEEQRRIGQDLHDGVGQELTGLAMMADALSTTMARRGEDEAAVAEKLADGLKRAVGLVRALSRGLNPVEVDPLGLQSALLELSQRVAELYSVPCLFHCDDHVLVPDAEISTQLYRIAQEAVNNAAKHAKARELQITLEKDDGRIRLRVTDDGVGIQDNRNAGLGMRSMGYRAGVIGGELHVRPGPRGGTIVECTLPANRSTG